MEKTDNTILIVEDAPLNIEKLTHILRDKYKLMIATNGEKAIKLMQNKVPDLVLLDVYMPGISGFDVLKFMKTRENLADIPVIFVSGEHDSSVEEKGLSLGAVDYVKKPFVETIIDVKVKRHLELKTYRDKLELLVYERTKQLEEHAIQLQERSKQLEDYTKLLEKSAKQLTSTRDAVIMGMSLMSEIHDNVTGSHIERIKIFTKIITDKMLQLYPNVITAEIANLYVLYSALHDVGKVGISDIILKKTGTLTPAEFETMKRHTVEGANLLRSIIGYLADETDKTNLRIAMEIAECHHEKFDGTGYPNGLKGNDIPLSARIVAVADIYDALRSPRQYKRAFTHTESMDILLKGDGRVSPSHFDPIVLEILQIVNEDFEKVSI